MNLYSFVFSFFVILGMISSFGVKAFSAARVVARSSMCKQSTAPARFSPAQRIINNINTNTARFMSTSEPDTSVVEVCTQKIGDALETENVKVTGAYDDPNGSHISIEVVSSLFEGKRAMQRQQLVYKAIWEELQGPVHAGTC